MNERRELASGSWWAMGYRPWASRFGVWWRADIVPTMNSGWVIR